MCVNIRYLNASIDRIGWLQGLPFNSTTSLAVTPSDLWVGTARGLARFNFGQKGWSYYYLQRYLPGASAVRSVAVGGSVAAVATDGGVVLLESQLWTLSKKAALFEDILARHDRFGTFLLTWSFPCMPFCS